MLGPDGRSRPDARPPTRFASSAALPPFARRCLSEGRKLYDALCRFGYTPWERADREPWACSVAQRLDLEDAERSRPLRRALDVGCGRGQYVPELVRRGWEVVGIDCIPRAIEAAQRQGITGATFLVGDVTDLPLAGLGTFEFFFDIGCFQHLDAERRQVAGRGITSLADPGATMLLMVFAKSTPIGSFVTGASAGDVEAAFPEWDLLSVEAAETGTMD
jgi:SAM-dependent methyltransferase